MTGINEHQRLVDRFRAINESNYIFACQAAVPLVLTPDLLYQLWNNFKQFQYIFDQTRFFRISHISVSDLLLSGLCKEVGIELYELEKEIRDILLTDLVVNLGEKRRNTIAAFLEDYAQLERFHTQRKNLKNIHLLTAHSILNPAQMEREIIDHINRAETDAEKINYLLLHNNLMPLGYESDLSKISNEIGSNNNKTLSPILIAEGNADTTGVLIVNINLPSILKNKIRKVSVQKGGLHEKDGGAAQLLIDECLQTRDDCLDFSNCKIYADDFAEGSLMDRALRRCVHITTLILQGQPELHQFPPAILELKNLTALRLGGEEKESSSITFLPAEISDLKQLELLDISDNKLIELPESIGTLNKLTKLKVNGNQLKTLPTTIGQLANLIELNITSNQIERLPDTLLRLPKLGKFWINNNPIAIGLSDNDLERPAQEILQLLFPRKDHKSLAESFPAEPGFESPGKLTASEDLQDIPDNRTLIAIKLTQDTPVNAEIVHGLYNIDAVFKYYRPGIIVNFIDEAGGIKNEKISFGSINDFSLKGMVDNVTFLQELMTKREQYQKIIRQLKANKLLKTVIENKGHLGSMLQALQALSMELQGNYLTEQTASTILLDRKDQNADKDIPEKLLNNATKDLEKFGGFDFLASTIDGVQYLDPERKARKKIFMEDLGKEDERKVIQQTLQLWTDVLNSSGDLSELIQTSQESLDEADYLLKRNLKLVFEQSRELEQSYRSVALFFKNAENEKVGNVNFINAELGQLKDLDNPAFIDLIADELRQNYDRLDLRSNYSILVIPGYLGSNKVIEKWAKIVYENKVLLVTDFENLDNAEDVMEAFISANLTGAQTYRSNVIMICNWLKGRGKYEEAGEMEDLFVSPASSLSGKIYNTSRSQVVAGRKFGGLNEVDEVKFDLKKSEIANLEQIGLIPLVSEFGKVMAFSAKSLFNGDNLGLQTYSVVRIFDYISKVLIDFLNRRAFENFNVQTEAERRRQIIRFLDSITGPGKLIESFGIMRFEKDTVQKDHVFIDIRIIPYFPAKTFLLKMEGYNGDDGFAWSTEYLQNR